MDHTRLKEADKTTTMLWVPIQEGKFRSEYDMIRCRIAKDRIRVFAEMRAIFRAVWP